MMFRGLPRQEPLPETSMKFVLTSSVSIDHQMFPAPGV